MKHQPITVLPFDLPHELAPLLSGARIYDSSSSADARVYFLDKDEGYYLKRAARGELAREAQLTAFFHSLGLGPQVVRYASTDTHDLLLTVRLNGEDGVHPKHLAEPKRLCDVFATALRALHETKVLDCPVPNRTQNYIDTVYENARRGQFDLSLFGDEHPFRSAEEALRVFEDGKGALSCDVLLHGDYCLPNIVLSDFRPTGFIDLGCGGIGDRHIDVFWGLWTLWYNLGTHALDERFLDAYGRDAVRTELLKVIAAAEIFG